MSDEGVLTPDEIDALLNAVNSGQIQLGSEGDEIVEAAARSYDLTSKERMVIRGRLPTLDIINERLSRSLRASLFNYLRKPIRIEHKRTEMVKFQEFLEGPGQASCLNLFRLAPLPTMNLMSLDNEVVFGLVDHLFGGIGNVLVQSRELSAIEVRLIVRVVTMVLEDLRKSWEPVIEVTPELLRTESNPTFANITSPDDVVIDIVFQLEMEPAPKGEFHIVMPYSGIESIRAVLASPSITLDEDTGQSLWRDTIRRIISEVDVDFRVLLGSSQISVRQLKALKVGDTITLDTEPSRPIPCAIQGFEKAWGRAVTSRGRVAVKLVAPVGTKPPEDEEAQTAPGERDERHRDQQPSFVGAEPRERR